MQILAYVAKKQYLCTGFNKVNLTINKHKYQMFNHQNLIAMKKIFFLAALLCASMMSFAIDWSEVAWLGNGVGPGYDQKYKAVVSPEMPAPGQINNLQINKETPVLHLCFPADDFGTFSLDASEYNKDGAGIFVHLDIFKAKETEFTIQCQGVTYTFTVYYEDGGSTGLDKVQRDEVQSTKVFRDGQLFIMNNGTKYNVQGKVVE